MNGHQLISSDRLAAVWAVVGMGGAQEALGEVRGRDVTGADRFAAHGTLLNVGFAVRLICRATRAVLLMRATQQHGLSLVLAGTCFQFGAQMCSSTCAALVDA